MTQSTDQGFHAHSANDAGHYHKLEDHLHGVATLAREFAEPFGGGEVAYYAGLWHDLGKFNPSFQRYLAGERSRGPDHKAAGTKLACQFFGRLGLLVQGHHGGLRAYRDLDGWLQEKGSEPAVDRALELARALMPNLEPNGPFTPPGFLTGDRADAELWMRMVFSALVDADFLDTERHFDPEQASAREPERDIQRMWDRFQRRHQDLARQSSGLIGELRSEIYQACLETAEHPQGLFRLTVPTGGGKTLSALGFALRHASIHDLKRVVVAVPFTAITQQTAAVYREFLEEQPDSGIGNGAGASLDDGKFRR